MKKGVFTSLPFVIFGILVVISFILSTRIYFSYNFEDFFPQGDPELDFYYTFREKFEHDDNFYVIAFENKKGILQQDFLYALDSATSAMAKLPDVENTLSLTQYRYFIFSPFGYIDYPALHIDDTARYVSDKEKIVADERIVGKLVNEDFTITTILLKINDTIGQKESADLVANLKNTLSAYDLYTYHMLGKAYFQAELIRLQRREFILYSFLSILLVTIITYVIFRRWACVLLCLTNVLITMILFLGLSGLLRIPYNALSTLYPIVLIIVGISDIIHVLTGYIFELKKGLYPAEAIRITKREIGLTTFITAITTAIGFLTLATSKVQPIREFGMMSAAGVLIAYLVTFYFTANMFPFIHQKWILRMKETNTARWDKLISFFYQTGISKSKTVAVTLILVVCVSFMGVLKISTNTHLGYGLPKNTQVLTDYDFFDDYFNGFRPFEIAAIAKDTFLVTDLVILQQIDAVENFAKSFDIVNGIQSTTLLYKSLHRAHHGDVVSAYMLPEDETTLEKYNTTLKKITPENINVLISEDKKCGRITATLTDVGTDSIRVMQQKINSFILQNTDTNQVEFIQTGTGIIFDKNTIYLRQNLINGLCFGFIPISLLIAFFHRNWKMFFISSIPNLVPLLICGGIIGIMGIELDAPTSIIFGIIYGIAVDDTIHFLSRFKQELNRGLSKEQAIFVTFNETGKAVFTSTLILLFGFSILMLSGTSATFNIGFLTTVTLLAAAISDVYLLPLLLRKWM
ncbi:MAG: MMPL family transporter [Chitinophagales bacterium]|nr:MMPL family transporter [Chitinophagales bacterium]